MSGRSTCPECGTILRIRDRSFVGRRVGCPECKVALRIASEDEQGDFISRRLTPDELASSAHPGRSSVDPVRDKIRLPTASTRSFFGRLVDSPLTAAWLLAIAISSLIAVLALAPKYRFAARPAPSRKTLEEPVEAVSNPGLISDRPVDPYAEAVLIDPKPSDITNEVELPAATALEPANIDGPLPSPPPASATDHGSKEPPATVAASPVKFDVRKNMQLELIAYEQSRPVSRRELIEALQEHLGAKIRYQADDLGTAELDQTITFQLENTTVGGVIQKVADAAGWKIIVEEDGLTLTRK